MGRGIWNICTDGKVAGICSVREWREKEEAAAFITWTLSRRGFTLSDWGKMGERHKVDWYEDNAGSHRASLDNMGERHYADKMGERYEYEDDVACATS